MKKQLAAGLLLVCGGADAATPSVQCRVKIGEDWIPLGATEVQSCLKYAEAASSPGEAQLAEFGSVSFTFRDGQYSRSTDGGRTWQPFSPHEGGASVSALSILRETPKPESPEPSAKERKETGAAGAATAVAKGQSEPPEPFPDPASAATSTDDPGHDAETLADNAGSDEAAGDAPSFRGCQLRVGANWQVFPTPTLVACGRLLAHRARQNSQSTGQAYWGDRFLFYSMDVLFQSADGEDWQELQ